MAEFDLLSDEDVYFEGTEPPRLPSRTLLVDLQPKGIGTYDCESLGGYWLRLADAHCLSPASLYRETLLPRLAAYCKTWKLENTWRSDKLTLGKYNGFGKLAHTWLSVMTEVTGIESLRHCTLTCLDDILSCEGLFLYCSQYCPICLAEATSYCDLYERLLWTLAPGGACIKHGVTLLQHACGAPSDKILPRPIRKRLFGVCRECGSIGYRCNKEQPKDEAERGIWFSKQLGDLISHLPDSTEPFSRERLRAGIAQATEYAGGIRSTASVSGLSSSTISVWVNGARPQLNALLNFCAALEISLLSVLCGQPEKSQVPRSKEQPKIRIRSSEIISLERQRCALERELARNFVSIPPRSLQAMASRLDIDRNQLARNFPALSKKIAERAKKFRDEEQARKVRQLRDTCNVAVTSLLEQGKEPTYKRLQDFMGTANMPRSRIRRIFDEVLVERNAVNSGK